jgi:hypothetical protein
MNYIVEVFMGERLSTSEGYGSCAKFMERIENIVQRIQWHYIARAWAVYEFPHVTITTSRVAM